MSHSSIFIGNKVAEEQILYLNNTGKVLKNNGEFMYAAKKF